MSRGQILRSTEIFIYQEDYDGFKHPGTYLPIPTNNHEPHTGKHCKTLSLFKVLRMMKNISQSRSLVCCFPVFCIAFNTTVVVPKVISRKLYKYKGFLKTSQEDWIKHVTEYGVIFPLPVLPCSQ